MASHAPSALGERALEARAPAHEVEGVGDVEMGGSDDRLSAGAIEGEASALSPVGLLDLPDELLLRIYELLASLCDMPYLPYERGPPLTSHALPLSAITINRRLCSIALPVREQVLRLQTHHIHSHVDYALETGAPHADCVRHLEIDLTGDVGPGRQGAHWVAPLITVFPFLITLSLKGPYGLPTAFTDSLKQLSRLRELSLTAGRFSNLDLPEDRSFSLEQLPALKTLTLGQVYGNPYPILRRGVANIQDLTVDILTDLLPWSTAERIHLAPRKGYIADPDYLLDRVWEATAPGKIFAVKDLVIEVESCNFSVSDNPDETGNWVIPELLDLLHQRGVALERLELRHFLTLVWGNCCVQIPSVTEYVLSCPGYYPARRAEHDLRNLLPSLFFFLMLSSAHSSCSLALAQR
ncbi:hypothetical protein JCM10213_001341 [Rhodosporidiobolus nylandii]